MELLLPGLVYRAISFKRLRQLPAIINREQMVTLGFRHNELTGITIAAVPIDYDGFPKYSSGSIKEESVWLDGC